MIPYMKYHLGDDIHWQWYQNNKHNYQSLVNDSVKIFDNVPTGSLVDIGAGDGLVLSLLEKKGFACMGVEPIREGVRHAMNHSVRAEYIIELAENFAKRKMEFDYLMSINTIEHLDQPECLVEIMKHIRQFGLIVTDNDEIPQSASIYHTEQFTPAKFEELFKDFELQRIAITAPEYFGYIIKNKKS